MDFEEEKNRTLVMILLLLHLLSICPNSSTMKAVCEGGCSTTIFE